MNKIVFSVIIPTLNEEKCLPQLLKSLVSQTYRGFEVIVVDGSSEDLTQKKALTFNSKLDLKLFTVKKRNVSFQRNFGATKAKTNILIFMDADTTIPSGFLRKIKKAFELKNPDLLTTYIKTDEKGIKPIETGTNLIFELGKAFGSPGLYGSMVVVKKRVFLKVGGFNQKLKFGEDAKLAQKIYKAGYKYVILHNTFYYWSLRRFRKLGTLKTLQKYVMLNIKNSLDYQMGGQTYIEDVVKNIKASKTKKLTAKMTDLFDRLEKTFS